GAHRSAGGEPQYDALRFNAAQQRPGEHQGEVFVCGVRGDGHETCLARTVVDAWLYQSGCDCVSFAAGGSGRKAGPWEPTFAPARVRRQTSISPLRMAISASSAAF